MLVKKQLPELNRYRNAILALENRYFVELLCYSEFHAIKRRSLYSVKLGVAQQLYEINKYIRSTSNGIERSKIIDKSRNQSGTVNLVTLAQCI